MSTEIKGYHLSEIPKGIYGQWSKVEEELAEYEDAKAQGSKIMMAVELADLWGALQAYTNSYTYFKSNSCRHTSQVNAVRNYMIEETLNLGLSSADLDTFSQITERAFKSGARS